MQGALRSRQRAVTFTAPEDACVVRKPATRWQSQLILHTRVHQTGSNKQQLRRSGGRAACEWSSSSCTCSRPRCDVQSSCGTGRPCSPASSQSSLAHLCTTARLASLHCMPSLDARGRPDPRTCRMTTNLTKCSKVNAKFPAPAAHIRGWSESAMLAVKWVSTRNHPPAV